MRFLCIPWRRRRDEESVEDVPLGIPDVEEAEKKVEDIERRVAALEARVEPYLARKNRGST